MKIVYLKNYKLTSKALEYIYKNSRSEFDDMINDLIEQKKNLFKEGWVKGKLKIRRKKNG